MLLTSGCTEGEEEEGGGGARAEGEGEKGAAPSTALCRCALCILDASVLSLSTVTGNYCSLPGAAAPFASLMQRLCNQCLARQCRACNGAEETSAASA
eukprot:3940293-Rhodomonas_salina.1